MMKASITLYKMYFYYYLSFRYFFLFLFLIAFPIKLCGCEGEAICGCCHFV